MEALEGFGDFRIGGKVIRTEKYEYADDFVLLAKEEALIHGMVEKLTDIGRCYGLEINVGKTKVIRMSRQSSPIQIMIYENSQRMWNISANWVAW
jgi:hypothetical protein